MNAIYRLLCKSAVTVGMVSALFLMHPNSLQAQMSQSSGSASATACQLSPKPNTLWSLAQCCSKDVKSNPSCILFDSKDDYVIIKDNDPKKPVAYLLIPSKKVTGIEDPAIFNPPFVDMWENAAYRAEKYPGKPTVQTGMAINSISGRDQNQLHIHISCISPAVKSVLESKDKQIPIYPAQPVNLQLPPNNNTYEAVKLTGLTGANSPYNVIQSFTGVKGNMGKQSIAVVGSKTAKQYYLLNTYVHGTDKGEAEELLDQTCK
jgi:CDP-diacylglycerol pyrophosphatase